MWANRSRSPLTSQPPVYLWSKYKCSAPDEVCLTQIRGGGSYFYYFGVLFLLILSKLTVGLNSFTTKQTYRKIQRTIWQTLRYLVPDPLESFFVFCCKILQLHLICPGNHPPTISYTPILLWFILFSHPPFSEVTIIPNLEFFIFLHISLTLINVYVFSKIYSTVLNIFKLYMHGFIQYDLFITCFYI